MINEAYVDRTVSSPACPGMDDAVAYPTLFYDLDTLLDGGLRRQELTLLAARPGMGKSALALAIALALAKAGAVVGFVSLEMARNAVVQRLVSMVSGVPLQSLRANTLTDEQRAQMMDGLGMLSGLGSTLFLDYTEGQTIGAVRGKMQRLQQQRGLDMVIVDYLGKLRPDTSNGNRVQDVGSISGGLRAMAKALDVPVLALSQLNRSLESRPNKVPVLSDLRESGDLEQDADVVLFLYREEHYDKFTDKKGIAEVHIAKNRQGRTGVVPLHYDAEHVLFRNLVRGRAVEGRQKEGAYGVG